MYFCEEEQTMSVNIVIDTLGGDNGAPVCVAGAVKGLKKNPDVKLYLTGRKKEIDGLLSKYDYDKNRIEVVDCSEEITCHDAPVEAVKKKKDSSLVVGLNLVKEGKADAFVSAGSSGAVLAGGSLIVGRAKGVKRTPLAPLIPTTEGMSLLIDCGANVDAKPEVLVQFAKMGSIYMENIVGVKNPRVAIVNIGTEEEKGNALVKETYPLMEKAPYNFVGNVEARDIPLDQADVVVTDGFGGNLILKYTEGLASALMGTIKQELMADTRGKIAGLIAKPAFKRVKKTMSSDEIGGAPLLGVQGAVIKAHGSSNAYAFCSAIGQCVKMIDGNVVQIIAEGVKKMLAADSEASSSEQ